VTESAVTAQIHESFDIHGDFRPQFTLDLVFAIDHLANAVDFGFREIVRTGVRIDFQFVQDSIGGRPSDAVNIGQADFNPFASR